MSTTFQVAIIESYCLMREGLTQVLRRHPFKLAAAWSNVEEAVSATDLAEDLSLILVSTVRLGMLEPNDAEMLRERYPTARIALLAESFDDSVAITAAADRVHGVILTSSMPANLVKSLELIALGETVFPRPSYQAHVDLAFSERERTSDLVTFEKLSSREKQVLAGLAKGESNKVIARQLEITDATVKVHVKSILRKTGSGNRTEAALWAHNFKFGAG